MKVPIHKRRSAPSPLILMKAQKNDVEVMGMKNAHLRDAVALCDFMSLLQDEVGATIINDWLIHYFGSMGVAGAANYKP